MGHSQTASTRPAAKGGLRSLPLVLAASALGGLVAAVIFMRRLSVGFDLRYFDSGLPMLVEADGYHYLQRSQELLAGKASWLQEPPLSALGALLRLGTGLPLELVAFWLPVGLALACGLWFWGWGRLLAASAAQTALAAFCGSLVPAWFLRSSPGWYDTDPGIAFFWHGCLLATARLGLTPGCPRGRDLLLFAACCLGLGWWWRPGVVMLPVCLLLWGGSYGFAKDRLWRGMRLATGLGVVLCGALFLLPPRGWLPGLLAPARRYVGIHAAMALRNSDVVVFQSIAELTPLSVAEILQGLGGTALAGVVALASVLLLILRRPRACVFLLPSLLALALALAAERFLFLAAVPVTLGIGLLPGLLPEVLPGLPLSARRTAQGAWVAGLGLVASLLFWHATHPLKFYFQAPQDRFALTLKQVAPPGARLWNWWDDGYFLAARSGLPPLFDGGSQSAGMSYIAAHPLGSDDPQLARRWIRFFALRGKDGVLPLLAAWGNGFEVLKRLDAVFSAPDPRAALAALPPLAPGADWLFPEGRVYLYLPQRFLRLSRWWIGIGKNPVPDARTLRPHIEAFERGGFRYVPGEAQVDLPEAVLKRGYTTFGGVFVTSRAPLAPPWGGGQPGPYVVASDLSPWLYVVDEEALASVAFRLLAPGGRELPGFAPVLTNFAHGGVWEVLP